MESILTDWNVAEELALALAILAVDVLVLNVVKHVLLETMAAETLARRPDRLAVRACLHVAPVHVKPVRSLLSHPCLIFLKLGLTHELASIVGPHDLLILQVSLDVTGSVPIHVNSFSHFAIQIIN